MSTRHELGDTLSVMESGSGQVTFYNHGLALLSLSTEQVQKLRTVLNDLQQARKQTK